MNRMILISSLCGGGAFKARVLRFYLQKKRAAEEKFFHRPQGYASI